MTNFVTHSEFEAIFKKKKKWILIFLRRAKDVFEKGVKRMAKAYRKS